jgi:hypothetical protein
MKLGMRRSWRMSLRVTDSRSDATSYPLLVNWLSLLMPITARFPTRSLLDRNSITLLTHAHQSRHCRR